MENSPESAVIRSRSRFFAAWFLAGAGLVSGAGLAAGGLYLAEQQETALSLLSMKEAEKSKRLTAALQDALLNGPRLRLEELAGLPLVPEYLAIVSEQPDSIDAEELNAYLETVLSAAVEETGFSRISLQSPDGSPLIDAVNPAETDDSSSQIELEAAVLGLDGAQHPGGKLVGYLTQADFQLIAPMTDNEVVETTASVPATAPGRTATGSYSSIASIPQMTRLLGLFAGLCATLLGLSGAVLLRRKAS